MLRTHDTQRLCSVGTLRSPVAPVHLCQRVPISAITPCSLCVVCALFVYSTPRSSRTKRNAKGEGKRQTTCTAKFVYSRNIDSTLFWLAKSAILSTNFRVDPIRSKRRMKGHLSMSLNPSARGVGFTTMRSASPRSPLKLNSTQ